MLNNTSTCVRGGKKGNAVTQCTLRIFERALCHCCTTVVLAHCMGGVSRIIFDKSLAPLILLLGISREVECMYITLIIVINSN